MKIYTKNGDQGFTSLSSGRRISKSDIRIETYGTIDELISYIGLLGDLYNGDHYKSFLIGIQDRLMTIASILACDNDMQNIKLPLLNDEDIIRLENEIDFIASKFAPLKSFILPGGNPTVSVCHITRAVCRRAERTVTRLSEKSELNPLILKYLNRLSDFLFMFSRLISSDLGLSEISWDPKL